jgi:hypothetical protein
MAAGGDITPLPWYDDIGKAHGFKLKQKTGDEVGKAMLAMIPIAAGAPDVPLSIRVAAGEWVPASENDSRWVVGRPVLGGPEDCRTILYPHLAREGMRSSHSSLPEYQKPKLPAMRLIQALSAATDFIQLSPSHPLNRVRFGDHVLATVPGEPTIVAGYRIEQAVVKAEVSIGAPVTASVLANSGDYVGYFTTCEEYESQQYEGAHTLYGKTSLGRLIAALTGLRYGNLRPLPRASPLRRNVSKCRGRSKETGSA